MAILFGSMPRPVGLGLAVMLGASLSLAVATTQATADTAVKAESAATVAAQRVKVYELLTKDGGYFYTASESEKNNAVTKYGWTVTQTPLYYLSPAPFDGGKPLYRLRYSKKTSYIVTGSVTERDKLVSSGNFRYEGVLGYAPGSTEAGGDVKVYRMSNNGRWRLAVEAHKNSILIKEPAWELNGPILFQFRQPN
ncbi:hypothetical protein B0I32_13727 [Nonomuraea fuscirosea]|uniref:DUF5648 domain-containing protein n=1 Tax=Nonomuraea fuscirosea TaxID=1291556 RepID=A0A2T0M1Z7_9ACTN|nr:hypothetical protein [Nonomuraea fuscirosea]PRX50740.1 hypothetical protein B0I32_13727 [Nonomuraea fuscirosea]